MPHRHARGNELRMTLHPDHRGRGGLTAPRPDSGDETGGVPPVPIPNTAVKPARPMIVPPARKSVIAGIPHRRPGPPTARGRGGPLRRRIEWKRSVHRWTQRDTDEERKGILVSS